MRWMLLVVVASAISVACRAALCELRRGARPPPAPPGRAHTARTAAGGGRVSRARQATHRTHTCTCTCACACDMCMCMCMCICTCMCARVAVPVGEGSTHSNASQPSAHIGRRVNWKGLLTLNNMNHLKWRLRMP